MSIGREDVDFRDYRRIFVDSNQTTARDDIRFGFSSDRKGITFKSGMETTFNYPLVSEANELYGSSGIPISATSMVVDGAICGNAPYQSDRVYMKMAGYGWKDRWGDAKPEIVQNGEWLCAWLSGDRDNPSAAAWMDRWYVASAVSGWEALSRMDGDGLADFPSDVRFAPGCMYMYDRIGQQDIEGFVGDTDASGLLIRMNTWRYSGCVNDAPDTSSVVGVEMVRCSSGMFGRRRISSDGDYGITFDGNGYVQVNPEDVAYPGSGDFTVSVFVEHDNWDDSTGDGIVDNGFHGGWRIAVSPRPKATMMSVLCEDSDGNQMLGIYDAQLNVKTRRTVDKDDIKNHMNIVCSDGEYYTWVVGNGSVMKLDLMGNVVHSTALPDFLSGRKCVGMQLLGNTSGATSAYGYGNAVLWASGGRSDVLDMMSMRFRGVGVDFNGTLNMVASAGCGWVDVEPDGVHLETDIDYDDGYHGVSTTVASDGTAFVIESPDDSEAVGGHRMIRIAKTKIDSFDRRGFVEFSPDYGRPVEAVATSRSVSGGVDDAIYVFFDLGYVVAFDTRLRRLWAKRVFSGRWRCVDVSCDYEFGRRFLNGVVYVRIVFGDSDLLNYNGGSRVLLTCPISDVPRMEWNMLSVVKDRNAVRMCVNGKTVAEHAFTEDERNSWKYVSYVEHVPVVLGATCGKSMALGDETGFENTKWNGSMDDFRMYSRALSEEELKFLVMGRYAVPDMVWNMEIPDKYYIEAVRRVYKMKMPGSKSAFYDVVVGGFGGDFQNGGKAGESAIAAIRKAIPEISPVYTRITGIGFHGKQRYD